MENESGGGFIGFGSAARHLGISEPALRRRVARGEVATWRDPLDDRRRLVRVRDLEALRSPRPIAR